MRGHQNTHEVMSCAQKPSITHSALSKQVSCSSLARKVQTVDQAHCLLRADSPSTEVSRQDCSWPRIVDVIPWWSSPIMNILLSSTRYSVDHFCPKQTTIQLPRPSTMISLNLRHLLPKRSALSHFHPLRFTLAVPSFDKPVSIH